MKKEKRIKQGLRLACLYSWGCEPLLKMDFPQLRIANFIKSSIRIDNRRFQRRIPWILKILKRLDPYYYYQLIACLFDVENPFDESVVRAHWQGEGLERIPEGFLSFFKGRLDFGFNPRSDRKKAIRIVLGPLRRICMLKKGFPFHNFDVFLQVKRMKKFTPRSLMYINGCLIRPAQVLGEKRIGQKNLLHVRIMFVFSENGCLKIGEREEFISPEFIEGVKEEEWVSVHFGWAREIITPKTAENIKKLTEQALAFSNQGG